MRKIAANYIFPVTSNPIRNGIIILDNNNKIIEIIENGGELPEFSNLEFYNGIIVPGFINSHCHLELSQKTPILNEGKGLVNFLKEISKLKKENSYNSDECILADHKMFQNGIQAVADISNLGFTSDIKNRSKIQYHTFVELIGLYDNNAEEVFELGEKICSEFQNPKSIVPHTPYTVSRKLLKKINNFCSTNELIITIHNQETNSENEMFISLTGELYEFVNYFQNNFNDYLPTKKSSIQSYLTYFSKSINLILVHNIFTTEEDIHFAENYSSNIYWCTCPASNLLIENRLPDLNFFYKNNVKIVIGTDSLASNYSLDILEEMKIIQKYFPDIPFQEILKWATINGANALKMNEQFGSLEIGKSPGIILIENFDFENFKLKSESKVKRLI